MKAALIPRQGFEKEAGYMTTQEEIREGIEYILQCKCGCSPNATIWAADAIIRKLDSQHVVIKVERELYKNPYDPLNEDHFKGYEMAVLRAKRAGYEATVPLIEE